MQSGLAELQGEVLRKSELGEWKEYVDQHMAWLVETVGRWSGEGESAVLGDAAVTSSGLVRLGGVEYVSVEDREGMGGPPQGPWYPPGTPPRGPLTGHAPRPEPGLVRPEPGLVREETPAPVTPPWKWEPTEGPPVGGPGNRSRPIAWRSVPPSLVGECGAFR